MSDEELIRELSLLFYKEIEADNQRYTDTIYDEVVKTRNIINELEKDLDKDFEVYICNGRKVGKSIELGYKICQKEILNKLKELKEGTNER